MSEHTDAIGIFLDKNSLCRASLQASLQAGARQRRRRVVCRDRGSDPRDGREVQRGVPPILQLQALVETWPLAGGSPAPPGGHSDLGRLQNAASELPPRVRTKVVEVGWVSLQPQATYSHLLGPSRGAWGVGGHLMEGGRKEALARPSTHRNQPRACPPSAHRIPATSLSPGHPATAAGLPSARTHILKSLITFINFSEELRITSYGESRLQLQQEGSEPNESTSPGPPQELDQLPRQI